MRRVRSAIFISIALITLGVAIGRVFSKEWRTNEFLVGYWYFLLFWMFVHLAIIPHELGHLVAALLAGFKPAMLSFNSGRRIASLVVRYLVCEIRALPGNGFVMATREHSPGWRWRAFVFIAGGPVANFLIGAACVQLIGWNHWWPPDLVSVSKLHLFAAANCAMGLFALLYPVNTITPMGPTKNDGRQLYDIVRHRTPDVRRLEILHAQAQALVANRQADVQRELAILTQAADCDDTGNEVCLSISACYIRLGDDHAARTLVQATLDRHVAHDLTRAYLLTHLAWSNLLIGGEYAMTDADAAAAEAITIAPWDAHVQSVAGAVLLSKGQVTAAYEMFKRAISGLDEPVARALCLCGWSACATRLGHAAAAARYARRGRRLDPACRLLKWTGGQPSPENAECGATT